MNKPRFTQSGTATSMTCRVTLNVRADAETVWALLTDAEDFPRWNPTITRIEGRIAEGSRLRLHVPGTTRTFAPKVSSVAYARRMVWSDGVAPLFKGIRTFTLEPRDDDSTEFVMEERFSGMVFALVKAKMPDFRPIFEAFAMALGQAAESQVRKDEAMAESLP